MNWVKRTAAIIGAGMIICSSHLISQEQVIPRSGGGWNAGAGDVTSSQLASATNLSQTASTNSAKSYADATFATTSQLLNSTNTSTLRVPATNVFSGGVLPAGTVASVAAPADGWILTSSNGLRNWSLNLGMGTNIQGANVVGAVATSTTATSATSATTATTSTFVSTATLTNQLWASNVVSGGQLPLGTVSTNSGVLGSGAFLTETGDKRAYSLNGSALTNLTGANVSGTVANATAATTATTATFVSTAQLTNKVSASNVVADSVLAPGTVASVAAPADGWILTSSNGLRNWSLNLGMGTNIQGANVVGAVATSTTATSVAASNVTSGGTLVMGALSSSNATAGGVYAVSDDGAARKVSTNLVTTALKTTIANGSANTLVVTNGNVGIGTTGPTAKLEVGTLTDDQGTPNVKVGGLELQPYTLGNELIAENLYYSGGWKYRSTGAAGSFYFQGTEGQFRFFASGTAGSALPTGTNGVSGGDTQFKVNADGTVALGGQMPYNTGVYTNATLIAKSGNVGIGTLVPATTLHVSGGSITLSNTSASSLPACILRTNMIGYFSVTTSNPPTSGAGTAWIFAATNSAGTAEIFTMDGAGVVKQISEHAMDAPPHMIDTNDPFPNISKEWNDYLGQVRWINRSREALVASGVIKLTANSYEAWLGIQAGTNVALLANNNYWTTNRSNWATSPLGTTWYNTMKSFVLASANDRVVTLTETYAEYNARLGLTSGMPGYLSTTTWTAVQNGIQIDYANSFTNAVMDYNTAITSGSTNVVAPVWSPPAVQPVPAWLYTRGVR